MGAIESAHRAAACRRRPFAASAAGFSGLVVVAAEVNEKLRQMAVAK